MTLLVALVVIFVGSSQAFTLHVNEGGCCCWKSRQGTFQGELISLPLSSARAVVPVLESSPQHMTSASLRSAHSSRGEGYRVRQVSAAPIIPSSGSSQLRGRVRDGGNSSAGRIYQASPTREEAPASTNESRNKRARRRPIIGPAVWAAFKGEQKGFTRALLGLSEGGALRKPADSSEVGAEKGSGKQQQQKKGRAQRQTLGAFMMERRSRSPEMEDMLPIMQAVEKACTAVSRLVRRAQLEGMAGLHHGGDGGGLAGSAPESVNIQGEVQKELDVLSNSIFLTGLCQPRGMSSVASEEEELPRMCAAVVGEETHGGEYAVVFDPLDGSANIEAGLPCGTIFGILRSSTSGSLREGRTAGPRTIVLPGRRLVAAGYCLYGLSTKLVFTIGEGVFEFTLEGELEDGGGWGESLGGGYLNFVLTKSNIKIPRKGNVYSVNEANSPTWPEAMQEFFGDLKVKMKKENEGSSLAKTPPRDVENLYAGALVADVHNILNNGGIFAYQADARNPNGKLRLLYEGNPIAMIVEEAGGIATTGFEPIREVRPQSVHHRTPAFFGSPDDLLPLFNPKYLDSKRWHR